MVKSKLGKLNDELEKAARKDLHGIKKAMQNPDILLALQCGEMKKSYKSLAMKNSEDEDVDVSKGAVTRQSVEGRSKREGVRKVEESEDDMESSL